MENRQKLSWQPCEDSPPAERKSNLIITIINTPQTHTPPEQRTLTNPPKTHTAINPSPKIPVTFTKHSISIRKEVGWTRTLT